MLSRLSITAWFNPNQNATPSHDGFAAQKKFSLRIGVEGGIRSVFPFFCTKNLAIMPVTLETPIAFAVLNGLFENVSYVKG